MSSHWLDKYIEQENTYWQRQGVPDKQATFAAAAEFTEIDEVVENEQRNHHPPTP